MWSGFKTSPLFSVNKNEANTHFKRLVVGSASWKRNSRSGASQRSRHTYRNGKGRCGTGLPWHVCKSLPTRRRARGWSSRRRWCAWGRRARRTGRSAGGARCCSCCASHAGSCGLVCLTLQSVRQSLLAWHASTLVLGAAHQRGTYSYRYKLRMGHSAGNHRWACQARPERE